MKDWGGGRVVLYHNPGHRLSFHSGHRVLLLLNFWALGFGFKKFWLKDSCIPKSTYLKLLLMMLMENLQFGFRVLVYPKLWCRIHDSIIPKLTVEKEKSLNPLTLKSDSHIISLYSIISESHINVMRIKEIITN